ncbi:MAG: hypothetical protein ACETWB_07970, partial [Anaerolineae bacterium]
KRKSTRIHPRVTTTLIAFANADSGWLLVGIEAHSTVVSRGARVDRSLSFCYTVYQKDRTSGGALCPIR